MKTLAFKGLKNLQRQKSNFNCNLISYEEIKSTEGHVGLNFTCKHGLDGFEILFGSDFQNMTGRPRDPGRY